MVLAIGIQSGRGRKTVLAGIGQPGGSSTTAAGIENVSDNFGTGLFCDVCRSVVRSVIYDDNVGFVGAGRERLAKGMYDAGNHRFLIVSRNYERNWGTMLCHFHLSIAS
jgi:hypothetical protein